MALQNFKFFSDAGLTTPITSLSSLLEYGGAAADHTVYLGFATAGYSLLAASDPGVDDIVISIVDANTGGGQPATAVKLATMQGGLAAAIAGDPLSLGTSIQSGVANAQAIWLRIADGASALGNYTDLSLETNQLQEGAA